MKKIAVSYSVTVNAQSELDPSRDTCLVCCGSDDLSKVVERGVEYGWYYLAIGKRDVAVHVEAVCAACSGMHNESVRRGKFYRLIPCRACKAGERPIEQPFKSPIRISTGVNPNLRAVIVDVAADSKIA